MTLDRSFPKRPHTALGRRGEELAARFLERKGWSVLERNFRAGRKEIDLIVRRGEVVAFVEVKTRSGEGYGHPLAAITWRKRREIEWVARAWCRENPAAGPVLRFDAVAVRLPPEGSGCIEHVEDAWRLG